ncbi:MAG: hypothetical protein M3Q47_08700 [Actinomycetota bacterium]|nr:hypothetical protein [Actinomycetota bacterium]
MRTALAGLPEVLLGGDRAREEVVAALGRGAGRVRPTGLRPRSRARG